MTQHVTLVEHPLVAHHLTRLRDRQTPPDEFRRLVRRLTMLLVYQATVDLPTDSVTVETPLCPAKGRRLRHRVAIVPILRAGLGMVEPVLELLPDAEVRHVGLYRDEATAQPVEYYCKLPPSDPPGVAIVLDPMLATGGSAAAALTVLQRWGVAQTKLLALIGAPEGVDHIVQSFPEAQLYVCAIDERLNAEKFIVPGLGDAGDRMFNTL